MGSWALGLIVVAGCGHLGFATASADGPEPSCTDGVRDGDETDIDCGGSCLACPGISCSLPSECVTGVCNAGTCELASAPPFWLPGPPLPAARKSLRCALEASGDILCVGGAIGGITVPTTVRLAVGATSFVPGPTMRTARSGHAVAAGSDVYAFAGYDAVGNLLNTLEILRSGAWSAGPSSSGVHAQIQGTMGADGNFYVIDSNGTAVYAPSKGSWIDRITPLDSRDNAGVACDTDGLIYAIGGSGTARADPAMDAFDPALGTWQSRAPMTTGRWAGAAVAAGDGRIYAIGGFLADNTPLASIEAYTPARDRWIDVAPLVHPRGDFGATLGADGRIYAAGGYGVTFDESSVEIYGPLITLSPASAAPGVAVSVLGSNFATSAPVAITFDGTVIAIGTTDGNGQITTSFVVPAAASGTHRVGGFDDMSRFPTTTPLQIP